MSRRRTALAAALSLLPLGQPLLLGSLTGITTATTAVILQTPPAVAQDSSAVARIAKAITVRIEGATQGSGVLVKKEGNRYTVLTAWHVVEDNNPGEELAIFTPDGKEHQLEQGSIQRLGEVDMAVLTFSSSGAYEVAEVGDIKKVKYDDPIYVAGFPLNNLQNLRYEPGKVVVNAEVGIDQGYQLLYDNKTVAGMSGGVLLNADGELVGLHGRGERDERASMGKEAIVKTGVNKGVPITFYKLFISGEPVVATSEVPTSADDYLAMAENQMGRDKRAQTVIRVSSKSLNIRPSGQGYSQRGNSLVRLGNYDAALADFKEAAAIDPKNFRHFSNMGVIYSIQGSYIKAIKAFTESIMINPGIPFVYNNRGNAKDQSGDHQGAIDDYNKAIAIDPQDASAYNNRGIAKGDLGDYQGAISDFTKAIEIDPQYSGYYERRGKLKKRLGDIEEAISDFTMAIEIDPQIISYYVERGMLKRTARDLQGAIADYNMAIQIDPNVPVVYSNRGNAKRYLRDYQGAIADFNKAILIDPGFPAFYTNRGAVREIIGDTKGACSDFKMAVSLGDKEEAKWLNSADGAWCRNTNQVAHSQGASTYVDKGIEKINRGDFQGAIADFNKALEINSQYIAAYNGRATAKWGLGDTQGAISDYSKAIVTNPQHPDAYNNRGLAKEFLGDLKGACSDWIKSISLGSKGTEKMLAERDLSWCRNMR